VVEDSVDVWRDRLIDALGVDPDRPLTIRRHLAATRLGDATRDEYRLNQAEEIDIDELAADVIEAVAVAAADGVVIEYADSRDLAVALARIWPALWSRRRARGGSPVIEGGSTSIVEYLLHALVDQE
jgi:hypothetical protein